MSADKYRGSLRSVITPHHAVCSAAAQWWLLVHRGAGVDLDVGSWVGRRRRGRPDSRLDLGSHSHKRLLNVCCTLCTRLQERNAQLVGIFLPWQAHTTSTLLFVHDRYTEVWTRLCIKLSDDIHLSSEADCEVTTTNVTTLNNVTCYYHDCMLLDWHT